MYAVELARPELRRRAAEAALRHRAPLSVERPRRFRGVAGEGRFPPRRPQRVDRGERADRTRCVREKSVQPIWHIERAVCVRRVGRAAAHDRGEPALQPGLRPSSLRAKRSNPERLVTPWIRSEEPTSELQSLMRISYAVF